MKVAAFIDDPDWSRFIPEMREGTRTRHLPTHEDCERVDVESAALHLTAGGTLGRMPGYEERPGQIDMLRAVLHVFNERKHLMIEAGTGVGKSLAYLVPSILWAWTNDTPVIISTATRNLQSQLLDSDIPRALEVLGDSAENFKVALLKGRGNYLCLRAVDEFFSAGFWTMSEEDKLIMPDFISFLKSTPDGDLDKYEGIPRTRLVCPGEECSGRRCPFYRKCFVYKARKNAAEAHLVVVNHALVMAEGASGGNGILPAYGRIVFDEAHNLESIATEYLQREFSVPAVARILNRLMRRGKGRHARSSGVLAGVERQLQKGVLAGNPVSEKVRRLLQNAPGLMLKVMNAAEDFAAVAAGLLKVADDRDICRYKTDENGVRSYSLNGLFKPYESDKLDERLLVEAQGRFDAALAALVNMLFDLRDTLNDSAPEGEFNYVADSAVQAGGIAESLVSLANEANFVVRGDKPTHAYWAERHRHEKRASFVRLVAAPLSVAEDLKEMFYEVKDSVVFSSATLRVGNDFRYMAKRLGAEERFEVLTAASPFDYLRQALVLAPDCLPDPSIDLSSYAASLAALMKDLFTASRARALVLFTSYEMMNAVAAEAREELEAVGIELLVQGEGVSRESMTRRLKDSSRTVLFGAQSFWEGVDVAGEALSCVVLARLPFAQVGEPIVEARAEKIEREGGSSFRDYSLPEAVIKFRQGFGRLIRGKTDRGVVVVTDPRIVTKNYGAVFRRSIPASVHTVSDLSELLTRVADFYGDTT